jgi:signal transduction histidine kinase
MPVLLMVDDQPINIQTLYQIFSADHTVFMATSGAQALKFCANQQPDLILLDVMMPGMDGHEVCRRLKADPLTVDIPIIFVTAQTNPDEETLGLQIGAVDFISKPVNAAVVRARVHAHLMLRNTLAQVKELNEGLEKRVVARTAELESALQRLQESQENLASSEAKATLSTLIASVSHELGTPIGNSVMASSALSDHSCAFQTLVDAGTLKRSDLTNFLSTVRDGSDLIQQNLRRASDLLKNFQQVTADQASEQRRTFDLGHVVAEIIYTLTPTLKRHPHRIEMQIAPGIEMDSLPGPLGQVVINLINNAYLHAFEGCTDGVLTIKADPQDDQVLLRFSDNGVGIPPNHMDRLFESFFSTKIGKGGTGLGMAIVQNLVTKTLGGAISVRSTLGQGTCFEIRLPRVLPPAV